MATRVLTGGAIKIDVIASNSQFNRAMEQARSRLRSFRLYARRVSRQIRGYWKAVAAAIAGTAAAIGVGVRQMVSYSSRLIEASRSANITTRSLENIRALFAGDGLGTEKATRAMVELNRRLGEAQLGSGTAKRALDGLGISLTTAEGAAKSTETIFFEMANALQQVETDSLAAQYAYDLLGRDGKEVAAIFRNLKGDVRSTAEEMGRFRTLSEEQHQANKDLGQSVENWTTALIDLVQRALSPLAGPLKSVFDTWTDFIQDLKSSPEVMQRVVSVFETLAQAMEKISEGAEAVLRAFLDLQRNTTGGADLSGMSAFFATPPNNPSVQTAKNSPGYDAEALGVAYPVPHGSVSDAAVLQMMNELGLGEQEIAQVREMLAWRAENPFEDNRSWWERAFQRIVYPDQYEQIEKAFERNNVGTLYGMPQLLQQLSGQSSETEQNRLLAEDFGVSIPQNVIDSIENNKEIVGAAIDKWIEFSKERDLYIKLREGRSPAQRLSMTTNFRDTERGKELLGEMESGYATIADNLNISLAFFQDLAEQADAARRLAEQAEEDTEKPLSEWEKLLQTTPMAGNFNPHLDHDIARLIGLRAAGNDPQMAFGTGIEFPSRPSRPNPYGLDFIDRQSISGNLPSASTIAELQRYAMELEKQAIKRITEKRVALQIERIRRNDVDDTIKFTRVGDPAQHGILPLFGTSQDSSRGAKERMMQQHNERLMALKPIYERWGKELLMDFDAGIGPLGHTITKAELKWEAMRKAFREADRRSVESLWAFENAQENKWQAQRTAFREADLASLEGRGVDMDIGRMGGPHRILMSRLLNAQPIDDNSPYRIGNLTNMSGDAYQGRVYGPDTDWQQMTSVATEKWLDELEKNKDKVKGSTNEMRNAFDQMGSSIVDNFENAGEALRQFARDIVKIGWQRLLLNPLGDKLFGPADGKGGSGVIGGFFDSIFPPAAAANGGMVRGMTLVGERGPELVDFSSPAMVTSNERIINALGGAGKGSSITIINNIESTDGPGVERALANAMPGFTAAAEARVLDSSSRYGTARKMLRGS